MAAHPQRTVGLLGGMSYASTLEYYRLINELVQARLGGLHSARIVLASVDFAEISQLQEAGDWETAGARLGQEAARLQGAGAELLVLCTNTMHRVADAIEAAVTIPLVHVADAAAAAVEAKGLTAAGLLGTRFTMDEPFYRDRLTAHGLDVLVPGEEDRALVNRVIFDELCRGIVRDDSRQRVRAVIARLVQAGAQGIILGCTEIELLIRESDAAGLAPLFPTVRLHAQAAVDAALV